MVRRHLDDEICHIPIDHSTIGDCTDENARSSGNMYEIYAAYNAGSYSSEYFWPPPLQQDRMHLYYATYNACTF